MIRHSYKNRWVLDQKGYWTKWALDQMSIGSSGYWTKWVFDQMGIGPKWVKTKWQFTQIIRLESWALKTHQSDSTHCKFNCKTWRHQDGISQLSWYHQDLLVLGSGAVVAWSIQVWNSRDQTPVNNSEVMLWQKIGCGASCPHLEHIKNIRRKRHISNADLFSLHYITHAFKTDAFLDIHTNVTIL